MTEDNRSEFEKQVDGKDHELSENAARAATAGGCWPATAPARGSSAPATNASRPGKRCAGTAPAGSPALASSKATSANGFWNS